jgi:hypothetical protein
MWCGDGICGEISDGNIAVGWEIWQRGIIRIIVSIAGDVVITL